MRFSARSKVGTLLSLVTIIALISTFIVTTLSRESATHASSASTFQGINVQAVNAGIIKVPSSIVGSRNSISRSSANSLPKLNLGLRTPSHNNQSSQNLGSAPGVNSTSVSSFSTTTGNLLHNFNGLSNLDNAALNPFTAEPPDQGLCAGYLTDQTTKLKIPMEFEVVNDIIAIYLPNGTLVAEESLGAFFGDVNFPTSNTKVEGDPRCHFDRQTHTFFFTVSVIGTSPFLPPSSLSRLDIAVINADTQKGAEYLFDTTDLANQNCPNGCFADAPNFGIDNNAVYVSTNEFSLSLESATFQGSELFVLSKVQLVNQGPLVRGVEFTQLILGGVPVFGLQPAINVSSAGSEYLENSFLAETVQNTLGLWHVTNDQNIANGVIPTISAVIIKVENYAFPMLAASTGTGVTTGGITSAAFLNPDDDRMQQVEGIQDGGNIKLWSALDTAISIQGDSKVRDGVAWFRINPQNASVVEQGYVASPGNYLLYPAILHTSNGTTAIVFTITSPTLNPSAANVVSPSIPTHFGSSINIAAQGANPYTTAFNRWGDYSAAALDLSGHNIWLATEYVPVQTGTTFFLNWGTRMFEVKGA